MANHRECLVVGCSGRTERAFCADCFRRIPEELRRKLQIGATKLRRHPDDARAQRKYSYVCSDALEALGEGD